jgi:hypothetical protein
MHFEAKILLKTSRTTIPNTLNQKDATGYDTKPAHLQQKQIWPLEMIL